MRHWTTFVMGIILIVAGYYAWRAESGTQETQAPGAGALAAGPREPHSPGSASKAASGGMVAKPREPINLSPASKVVMYEYTGDPGARVWEQRLKLRGISIESVTVGGFDDIKKLGLEDALQGTGIMNANKSVQLPFFSVDGRLTANDGVKSALMRMPLTHARENDGTYVILYGVLGCPKARRGKQQLDSLGVPYEFRDVNDPRFQPRFTALIEAHRIKPLDWPLFDINGRILVKPSTDEMGAAYRQ